MGPAVILLARATDPSAELTRYFVHLCGPRGRRTASIEQANILCKELRCVELRGRWQLPTREALASNASTSNHGCGPVTTSGQQRLDTCLLINNAGRKDECKKAVGAHPPFGAVALHSICAPSLGELQEIEVWYESGDVEKHRQWTGHAAIVVDDEATGKRHVRQNKHSIYPALSDIFNRVLCQVMHSSV